VLSVTISEAIIPSLYVSLRCLKDDFNFTFYLTRYSRTPLIRTLVIRIAEYPDQLGTSGKFVENSTKLSCLEIDGHRIKYITV